jgi:hypothetical protein
MSEAPSPGSGESTDTCIEKYSLEDFRREILHPSDQFEAVLEGTGIRRSSVQPIGLLDCGLGRCTESVAALWVTNHMAGQ